MRDKAVKPATTAMTTAICRPLPEHAETVQHKTRECCILEMVRYNVLYSCRRLSLEAMKAKSLLEAQSEFAHSGFVKWPKGPEIAIACANPPPPELLPAKSGRLPPARQEDRVAGVRQAAPANPCRVIEGADECSLRKINDDRIALAIWHRSPPGCLARWLDALPVDHMPEGHFIGPAACVPARLSTLCDLVEIRDGPQRRAFVADIARLAKSFAALSGSPDIDLRLEAVDHDSCWRFHRDHVGYRLNATYRGPGTQWLPPEHAARALRSQRRYRGPLHELPRFAAGLFKGVARAGDGAIVHRSPPVAGTGQTRLLLCLNEVRDDD